MSIRITESQLRRIVREEYAKTHPKGRYLIARSHGRVMTEARARQVANQMMNEGLFDVIKAGFSAITGGAGEAKKLLGDKAAGALKPVQDALAAVSAAAKKAVDNAKLAVGEIKDAALKAAIEKYKESLSASIRDTVKKKIAEGVKDLTPAFKGDEKAARAFVAQLVAAEAASIVASGGEAK